MEDFQLPDFESVKILVCGDVMLDQYWYGDTTRISPEAPVPVVRVDHIQASPGGAANVALNIAALGAKTDLLGLVGNDTEAETLQSALNKKSIGCYFQMFPDRPTITKLRVLGRNQQLIRMDFEKQFFGVDDRPLLKQYRQQLTGVDAIILSDYAKGTLQNVQTLIACAKEKGIPTLVDPKSEDFSKYAGATVITPNRQEFEAVVGVCYSIEDIQNKAIRLLESLEIAALLVTLGKDGMLLIQKNEKPYHLKTHAREVYDVTGAGDTVIAILSAAMASGFPLEGSARLANTAAGIVVGKLGAGTVSVPELRCALQRQSGSHLGVLTEAQLLLAVSDARAHGEKIVMTNGCFDLLHAGHVKYLDTARSFGNRLIVAVNDDASVKRLKGESRPLNTLNARMDVMASLRSVDWVVPFSEETPARLIEAVMPDVLVKGGDYCVEETVGSDVVMANGGEVNIVDFVPGYSTTNLVNKIENRIVEEVES